MVPVAREICLSGHANGHIVVNMMNIISVATIVTIGFMIAGSNHVWLGRCKGGHFFIEGVQDRFVHFGAFGD